MKPERITVTGRSGDKWIVSIEPRGMPETLQTGGSWIIGWFVAGVFYNNQYKIIVRRFHPKRTKAPRLYNTEY